MRAMVKVAMVAALLSVAAPVTGSADPGTRCENPYAKVTQPSGGQVVINNMVLTQLGNGQSLTLSSTGWVNVEIEHDCALEVTLVVTKTAPGAPTVIHNKTFGPLSCDPGTIVEPVHFGLDGGNYTFDVSGIACDGRKLRSDGHGGTVIDPPLR